MANSSAFDDYVNQSGNWFCCVSNIDEQREELKKAVLEFPFWSWIDHEPDDEHGKPHTHFMFRTKGTMKIKHIAGQLNIPANMVQLVGLGEHKSGKGKRAYGRYMIHLDSPDKKQYTINDIHTNRKVNFEIWITDNQDTDVRRLFADLQKIRDKELSVSQFVDLHYLELQQMNMFQQVNIFRTLNRIRHEL